MQILTLDMVVKELQHSQSLFFLLLRACIDTSEKGELESGIHLGEYRLTHQWAPLTAIDRYNVSINVHNDGNVLEIVGMCCEYVMWW